MYPKNSTAWCPISLTPLTNSMNTIKTQVHVKQPNIPHSRTMHKSGLKKATCHKAMNDEICKRRNTSTYILVFRLKDQNTPQQSTISSAPPQL
mmetsp:Transcript_143741/g.261494  ORF Transcript_143741/g.261494 Transcript_143741/m.261494 type:complete len:93 (-) Transcript_143741:465-743(-)